MLVLILHLVLVALLTFPESAVTGPIRGDSKAGAFFYLANFGYIEGSKNEDTAPLMTEDVLTDAIKKFQVCIFIKFLFDSFAFFGIHF